jgi:glycosyltransferase involved in cell wall biosynthesis
MLYLDVTSAALSSLNTGVQRVTRGLYAALVRQRPVTPLLWDDRKGTYCLLPPRQQRYLADPFEGRRASKSQPASFWQRQWLALRLPRYKIDLHRKMAPEDLLLVPEIFPDRRAEFLPALSRDRRILGIFHDAISWTHPEWSNASRGLRFDEYLRTLAAFETVACVSHDSENILLSLWKEWGAPPAPTRTESWPIDQAGKPRPPAAPATSRNILCVGTLEKRKNHLSLLQAAELLWAAGEEFRLILIGRSNKFWGPSVIAEIERLRRKGLPLEWRRHVDNDTLDAAYRECLFTVYPSLAEGFGLPILESLWHGKPCICRGDGAIGETARGGGCLPVDTAAPAVLADGMSLLLRDESRRAALAAEAQQRRFRTWEEYIGWIPSSGTLPA